MLHSNYQWDPSRPRIAVPGGDLTRVLHTQPRPATVDEYAQLLGRDIDSVMSSLAVALDAGWLELDLVAGQLFVNTAPQGRPGPAGMPDCPPNTWELLKRGANEKFAWALWKLIRSMESVGWGVHVDPAVIAASCRGVEAVPHLAVTVAAAVVPTLVFPPVSRLQTGSLLDPFEFANCSSVGVVCDQGQLEAVVTACRAWMLNGRRHELGVLVLEAPRYSPVVVDPLDGSTQAISALTGW